MTKTVELPVGVRVGVRAVRGVARIGGVTGVCIRYHRRRNRGAGRGGVSAICVCVRVGNSVIRCTAASHAKSTKSQN